MIDCGRHRVKKALLIIVFVVAAFASAPPAAQFIAAPSLDYDYYKVKVQGPRSAKLADLPSFGPLRAITSSGSTLVREVTTKEPQ